MKLFFEAMQIFLGIMAGAGITILVIFMIMLALTKAYELYDRIRKKKK